MEGLLRFNKFNYQSSVSCKLCIYMNLEICLQTQDLSKAQIDKGVFINHFVPRYFIVMMDTLSDQYQVKAITEITNQDFQLLVIKSIVLIFFVILIEIECWIQKIDETQSEKTIDQFTINLLLSGYFANHFRSNHGNKQTRLKLTICKIYWTTYSGLFRFYFFPNPMQIQLLQSKCSINRKLSYFFLAIASQTMKELVLLKELAPTDFLPVAEVRYKQFYEYFTISNIQNERREVFNNMIDQRIQRIQLQGHKQCMDQYANYQNTETLMSIQPSIESIKRVVTCNFINPYRSHL